MQGLTIQAALAVVQVVKQAQRAAAEFGGTGYEAYGVSGRLLIAMCPGLHRH